MSEELDPLRLPVGVVGLLQRAVQSEVLGSVESMALVLSETGWARGLRSGSWSYGADPSWSVQSAGHPPRVVDLRLRQRCAARAMYRFATCSAELTAAWAAVSSRGTLELEQVD